MGRARQARGMAHLGHLHRADHAADIQHIGLDDIDGAQRDHPPPILQIPILLAACHIHAECGADFGGLFQLPIGAGFLEMLVAIVLQHMAHGNRALG